MTPAPLEAWIDHVFNHAVHEPVWFTSVDAEPWTGPREHIPLLITFEHAGNGGPTLHNYRPRNHSNGYGVMHTGRAQQN